MISLRGNRPPGAGILYFGDPWHIPASANIDSVLMKPISGLPFGRVNDLNGPLSKVAAYETTNVPENYSLSFSITPTGTASDWSSIIHYSGDKSDVGSKGRMPGIFFPKSN